MDLADDWIMQDNGSLDYEAIISLFIELFKKELAFFDGQVL